MSLLKILLSVFLIEKGRYLTNVIAVTRLGLGDYEIPSMCVQVCTFVIFLLALLKAQICRTSFSNMHTDIWYS